MRKTLRSYYEVVKKTALPSLKSRNSLERVVRKSRAIFVIRTCGAQVSRLGVAPERISSEYNQEFDKKFITIRKEKSENLENEGKFQW